MKTGRAIVATFLYNFIIKIRLLGGAARNSFSYSDRATPIVYQFAIALSVTYYFLCSCGRAFVATFQGVLSNLTNR